MTRARELGKLANTNTLTADNTNNFVGIASTQPTTRLDVVGVVSATSFSGNGANLTGVTATDVGTLGNLNVTGIGTFGGNVTIGGTLTYDDVTNVDSVGIITARSHVSIADSILHTGDTDTSIRFPAANTFTVETGGSEALRVDSSQILLLGTQSARNTHGGAAARLQIEGTNTATAGLSITRKDDGGGAPTFAFGKTRDGSVVESGDNLGAIYWQADDGTDLATPACSINAEVDGTPGGNDMPGRLIFSTTADGASSETERLRITSGGKVGIDDTSPENTLSIKNIGSFDGDANSFYFGSNFTGTGANFSGSGKHAQRFFFNNASSNGYLRYDNTGGTGTAGNAITWQERFRITSRGGFLFNNAELIENVEVVSGKLSDNTNIDLEDGMVYLFTTAETTTSTPNIRINSSTTLESVMGNGKAISVTIMTTAAAAGYFTTAKIDGNANGENSYTLNVDWLGGSAPSAGGSSGIDAYNLTIIKQSTKNFNILIAQNNYA